jgi:hypothetical protein
MMQEASLAERLLHLLWSPEKYLLIDDETMKLLGVDMSRRQVQWGADPAGL